MFYEKLDYKVDIDKLRKEIEDNVFTLGKQKIQAEEFESPEYHGFGGWSLLSRTGEYTDGWEVFHTSDEETREACFPNGVTNFKAMKYLDIAHPFEHKNPTQGCVGEVAKVLSDLEEMGFHPRRARVTCLQAHCKSLVHKDGDGNNGNYMARIHIPIITNPKCIHIAEGINLHMPADGSVYIVWVNNWHQIRNDSDEDRYHIIMDAYDTKHVTKNFHYNGNVAALDAAATEYRKSIDAVSLSTADIEFFDKLKQKHIHKK